MAEEDNLSPLDEINLSNKMQRQKKVQEQINLKEEARKRRQQTIQISEVITETDLAQWLFNQCEIAIKNLEIQEDIESLFKVGDVNGQRKAYRKVQNFILNKINEGEDIKEQINAEETARVDKINKDLRVRTDIPDE